MFGEQKACRKDNLAQQGRVPHTSLCNPGCNLKPIKTETAIANESRTNEGWEIMGVAIV